MDCGEVVVEVLSKFGCRYVFGIPGVHNLEIYRALLNKEGVKHVLAKHEGNAGVMADVYGRLVGEPGILLTIAGPGATNCVTAIAQAYASASPVIHISGDVPTRAYEWPLHGLNSSDFLVNVFKPVTKWATRIESVGDIVPTLIKAYEVSTRGRMGPVHISIPIDILRSEYRGQLHQIPKPERWCVAGRIDDGTVNRLLMSRRLVVYAGKDVARYQCEEELLELCEVLRAPLIVHGRREGDEVVIPQDHPLYAGFVGGYTHPAALHALNSADLLLTVGITLKGVEVECVKAFRSIECVHIVAEGYHTADKIIVGNPKETLKHLIERLKVSPRRGVDEHLLYQISQIKKEVSEKIRGEIESHENNKPLHPGVVAKILSSVFTNNSILTVDCGLSTFWFRDVYPIRCVRGMISAGGYAAMGFSLPAAIAAKFVYPDKNVIAITGDGGLLMSYADLPTLIENNLNIVVVVLNDSKYGQVWQLQKGRFGGKTIATDLQPTDFATIFSACGGTGIRVETVEEAKKAFEEASTSKKPTLIDIKTDPSYSAPGVNLYHQNPKLLIGMVNK
jgi:acetolactate synthase-1/2/3 large subunit